MTDEEFERLRIDMADGADPHSILNLPREKQEKLLEAAFSRLRDYTENHTWSVSRLAGALLKAGVAASDETVMEWIDAQARSKYPFSGFPMAGFVQWVEQRDKEGLLSIRLLSCLRNHLRAFSRLASDKSHRELIRRLSVALKLMSDAVIPEGRDAWTAVALTKAEFLQPEAKEAWEALLKLANDQTSSKPGKSYLNQARAILTDLAEFAKMMRDILEAIGSEGPVIVRFRGYPSGRTDLLDEDFTDLLRALIWLCDSYPALTSQLQLAGERCSLKIRNVGPRSAKIAAVCAMVLSQMDSPSARHGLSSIQQVAKHKSTRKGVRKAIASAEKRADEDWSTLEENSVPDHGLSISPNPCLTISGYSASLGTTVTGSPTLLWTDGITPPVTQLPARIRQEYPEKIAGMKSIMREVKKTWKSQITRLERMMCEGRITPYAIWRTRYLNHPILGLLSRRLLWQVNGTSIGFSSSGDPAHADLITTIQGEMLTPPETGTVRLWHPVELPEEERRAWERRVLDERLIQPFQQAMRECHRRDEASGNPCEDIRFAGELLHQGAFAALCRLRNWDYSFHGGDSQFEPSVRFGNTGIRAVLKITEELRPGLADGGLVVWLRIVHVKFQSGSNDSPLDLKSVPPAIFSEVMRDIGIFLHASQATHDSGWRDTIPGQEQDSGGD